jgi:signal transduction histidine kinase
MFTLANLTDLMVKSVGPQMFFPYWPKPGLLLHPFILMLILVAVEAIRLIYSQRKHSSPEVRSNISWVVAAITIAWVSGASNFFLWYGIKIPPYANVLASLSATAMILFYFKLGYFGVQKMIKQISMLLVIYTTLLAVVLPAAVPLAGRFLRNPAMNPMGTLIAFGIMMGLVLSAGPFIYVYFIRRQYWLRGHLSMGLTHELKSPLGVIHNALDTIAAELAAPHINVEKTSTYVDMIRRHIFRLDNNVNVEKGPINISRLVEDMLLSFIDQLSQKNLTLQSSIDSNVTTTADAEKIGQVIGNMMSNAIKFSDKGTIHVALGDNGGDLVFSVRDEGKGIRRNELGRIFERFYQGKNSSKGSGLGLAIAKAWVEAHHGKIWAESDGEGKGTKIIFTLPK